MFCMLNHELFENDFVDVSTTFIFQFSLDALQADKILEKTRLNMLTFRNNAVST